MFKRYVLIIYDLNETTKALKEENDPSSLV